MGKSVKRTHHVGAPSPTGLISVKQAEIDSELMADDKESIKALMEKLSSGDADERQFGCDSLAAFVSNPATLSELQSINAVRVITPLLCDDMPAVRLSATKLLRDMSEEGGFEACEVMLRQGVFTGLGASLKKQLAFWKDLPGSVKPDAQMHGFVNSIYTVQNLCECSALAVRMCTEDSIPEVLLSCLDSAKFSPSILLATAQCLCTVSEENEVVSDLLRQPASQSALSSLLNNEKILLYVRVLLAGVQFNNYGLELVKMDTTGVIVSLLLLALEADSHSTLCNIVSTNVPSLAKKTAQKPPVKEKGVQDMDEDADTKPKQMDLHKEVESLDHLISAQKLSLEILTNILGSDDTDEWADMDADDETGSCGTSGSAGDVMEDDEDMESSPSDNPIVTLLAEKGVVKLLGERLKFIEPLIYAAVENSDKIHQQILQSSIRGYDSMLVSALLCLNNTLSQVKLDTFGGPEALQAMQSHFIAVLSTPQISTQQDLVESITTALSSTTKLLISKSHLVTFTDAEMNTLQHLTTSTHTATAVNAVRCFSAVGAALSKQPTANPVIKTIGTVLMQAATSSEELWLVAEALDSLMDVFAEDTNNEYLKELGIISTLQTILPQLKSMIAKRNKSNNSFLPVLTVVKSNLPRFIKYKNKVLH